MLRELHIRHLAVIEDVHVELDAGLNVFTGQTGAGKSLVLGAFELLLGKRASADMLRAGAGEGRVTGVFEVTDSRLRRRVAEAADLNASSWLEGEPLLVSRKITENGRSSASLAGQPATVEMLRQVGELLIDMHASDDGSASVAGEAQCLLRPGNQLDILDHFSGCAEQRLQYAAAHQRLQTLLEKREEVSRGSALRSEHLDLFRFHAREIDLVNPTEGEFEELVARYRVMTGTEKILRIGADVLGALDDGEESAVNRIRYGLALLRELAEVDPSLCEVCELTQSAAEQLSDAIFTLSRYLSRQDLNAQELGEITDRLNALNRLISKYGQEGGLPAVISHRVELAKKIRVLEQGGADFESLDHAIEETMHQVQILGAELRKARRAAGDTLKSMVEAELTELAMPHAAFEVELAPLNKPAASGLDRVEFLMSANPGLPLRPLRLAASGGELSRVMLALKTVLADAHRVCVLIFDEIDAKIGGRLGNVIGAKLRDLSRRHQVLCITHLPQIAAFAHAHFKIEKNIVGPYTATSVRRLIDHEDRREELAEMITGSRITPTSRAQAEELLGNAREGVSPVVSTRSASPATKASKSLNRSAGRPSSKRTHRPRRK